jgi:hypothetical protein
MDELNNFMNGKGYYLFRTIGGNGVFKKITSE